MAIDPRFDSTCMSKLLSAFLFVILYVKYYEISIGERRFKFKISLIFALFIHNSDYVWATPALLTTIEISKPFVSISSLEIKFSFYRSPRSITMIHVSTSGYFWSISLDTCSSLLLDLLTNTILNPHFANSNANCSPIPEVQPVIKAQEPLP